MTFYKKVKNYGKVLQKCHYIFHSLYICETSSPRHRIHVLAVCPSPPQQQSPCPQMCDIAEVTDGNVRDQYGTRQESTSLV